MLIYVSGPYSGDVDRNIEQAAYIAKELWAMGHAVICPHLNTAHFEDADIGVTYDDYIAGDLKIIARCDAVVCTKDWETSKGAKIEVKYARKLKIPCYTYPNLPPLHPTEVRCPQQAIAFAEACGMVYRGHLKKNKDYSPANISGTGEIGLVTRIWDKTIRLMNLTGFDIYAEFRSFDGAKVPENESTDDSYFDLGAYGIIGLVKRWGKWGK